MIGPGNPDRLRAQLDQYFTGNANLAGAFNGEHLVGILGFLVEDSVVVLKHIATEPSSRKLQVGRLLVEWLATRHPDFTITAETDTDSVGFYRRLGFTVTALGDKYPGVHRFAVRREPS